MATSTSVSRFGWIPDRKDAVRGDGKKKRLSNRRRNAGYVVRSIRLDTRTEERSGLRNDSECDEWNGFEL